jgi:signal transduction histidine kinase
VLLVVRQAPSLRAISAVSFYPALLDNPAFLEEAVRRLETPGPGWVDWNLSSVQPVYQSALCYAQTAQALAEQTGLCDPENAWVAGLLVPLSWLGVCAVNPDRAAACLADPEFVRQPSETQRRHWGVDAAGLGRRLARRWRLPDWVAAIVGNLALPVETAEGLGADPDLFRVVQHAVTLVDQRGIANCTLQIANCKLEEELANSEPEQPDSVPNAERSVVSTQYSVLNTETWRNPIDEPLLKELLTLAAQNLRLRGAPLLVQVERDLDELHRAFEAERQAQSERLQEQKLTALAEFAAGAGHEINNPLAVISGQAQYLLKKLQSAECRLPLGPEDCVPVGPQPSAMCGSLETIVAQAQRIHHVLRDLMQFARPPQPCKEHVDLTVLVREAAVSVQELAEQRRVRLIFPDVDTPLYVIADPGQVRTTLACLLRNAVEAAPSEPECDGWASIRLAPPCDGWIEVVVEDSGPGPTEPQREHLFDPFFSGRAAGRGRGLGLPTAWRLARQHGGDVRFNRPAGGPTRFLLTLPYQVGQNGLAVTEQQLGKSA